MKKNGFIKAFVLLFFGVMIVFLIAYQKGDIHLPDFEDESVAFDTLKPSDINHFPELEKRLTEKSLLSSSKSIVISQETSYPDTFYKDSKMYIMVDLNTVITPKELK